MTRGAGQRPGAPRVSTVLKVAKGSAGLGRFVQEAPSVKLVLLEPQQAVAALSRLSVAEVPLRREAGAGVVPSRSMVVAEVGTVISQRVAVEVPLRPEVVAWVLTARI